MATFARFGRWWEGPPQRWYWKLLDNLRSQLTWPDFMVGLCAITFFSITLIGLRFEYIPDYTLGQVADQDVRASQNLTYEDTAATDFKRAEAEVGVASVYQLDSDHISERVKSVSTAFARARGLLEQNGQSVAPDRELLKELESQIGRVFPTPVIAVFLHQRFGTAIENRIVKILDSVLRDGIISDRSKFLKDQRTGIVVRDGAFPFEHPLTDAYVARDLPTAREYLRQFRSDFPDLLPREQQIILEYLEGALFPTLVYDRQETEIRRAQAALRIQPVKLQIRQGQTIIRSGEEVTAIILLQLDALRKLQRPRSLIWQFGGYFLLSAIFVYSLWRYLVFYQTRNRKIRHQMVLILVIVASQLLTLRIGTALADILGQRFQRFHDPSVLYYGIPLAFGALLTTLLVDVNIGIITSVTLAVLTGLYYGDVDLAAYLIIGSFAGIYSVRQYKDRAAIVKAGFTIGIVSILCLSGLAVMRQTSLSLSDMVDQFTLAIISGMLSAALASMLLPALEAIFKIVTDIRLLELSNLNAPMLRRLSVEAPGTYHHSLMVATLAEVAAESVGANSLLARVAAYYHDLGKLLKPDYFVENQAYEANKHEDLSPSTSCEIISSHVKDGLRLAKEIGLPQVISDMIPQHHGTRMMTYFFQKAREVANGSSGGMAEADFRYPGPKPQSREAAIVMMADSVEAASRTLVKPTAVQVQGLIDRLVDDIVDDNQLDECDLTLRDVRLVKESFAKILTGIYHHRIDYPGYDFKGSDDDSREAVTQNSGPEQTTSA